LQKPCKDRNKYLWKKKKENVISGNILMLFLVASIEARKRKATIQATNSSHPLLGKTENNDNE
jgi:hypothetical protein